jgi:predicted transcriptional regulator
MTLQNLSYKLLRAYLSLLADSRLVAIEVDEKRTLVSTTQEGLDALSRYRGAISALKRQFVAKPE